MVFCYPSSINFGGKLEKLISVIVPVYNVEKYLYKCIESIRKQTYNHLEIILVDDGSTDSSGNICDKFKEIDNRIRVIHKVNGGLSEARNVGIDCAKGDFISFIDSDDYIENNMLETLLNDLLSHSADISASAYDMVYSNYTIDIKEGNDLQLYTKEEALKVYLQTNNIGVIACNKLYKSYLFSNVRYPIGQHFEDINTTYKLIANAKRIVYRPQIFYHYVQRNSSINGKGFNSVSFNYKLYDMIKATDELLDFIKVNFPNILKNIEICSCSYYLRVINQEILYGIEENNLRKKIKDLIKKNAISILEANYIGAKKKIQYIIYAYFFVLYKRIVLIEMRKKK